MTGYVKSYDKTDGVDTINSGDFEAEFNAIQSAFDQTSGHKHDGTASEGPYIQFISDSANKNKVVTDGSNNELEFWINASGLAVQQLSLTDGLLAPVTTNDVDLGSTSKKFKKIFCDNIATSAIFDVKSYGATGNGSTDDTTAIAAAVTAATSTGGIVFFPPGTYITTKITLPSKVILKGSGSANTVIKLKNASNTALIESTNFSSLSGYNKWLVSTEGMNHGFGLIGLTLDGNKSNQSSGNCVNFYGKRYYIDDVIIKDAYAVGLYTEGGDKGGQLTVDDMPECFINNLYVYMPGSHGIQYRGPHDGYINSAYISQAGGNGFINERSAGVYHGGLTINNIHAYACTEACIDISSSLDGGLLIGESGYKEGVILRTPSAGTSVGMISSVRAYNNDKNALGFYNVVVGSGMQIGTIHVADAYQSAGGVQITSSGSQISNVNVIASGTALNGKGLRIESDITFSVANAHIQSYTGASGVGISFGGNNSRGILNAYTSDCTTHVAFDNSVAHNNFINVVGFQNTGQTAVSGTPSISYTNHIEFSFSKLGGTGSPYHEIYGPAYTVDSGHNFAIGLDAAKNGALATSATDGFFHLPSCAGIPTGVPTTFTGRKPLIVDSTNNQLYLYNSGWRPIDIGNTFINVKAYGAKGDGTTNDTTAIQNAINACATGGVVYFPIGDYSTGALTISTPITLLGASPAPWIPKSETWNAGTRLTARAGTTGFLITVDRSTSPRNYGESLYGVNLRDITLHGNARTISCGGVSLSNIDHCYWSNVYITSFKYEGIKFDCAVRESTFDKVVLRYCGSVADGKYALDLYDDNAGARDTHNNITFIDFQNSYFCGHGIRLGTDSGATSNTRQIKFIGGISHGLLAEVDAAPYVVTTAQKALNHVVIGDCDSVWFIGMDFNVCGIATPMVHVTSDQNDATHFSAFIACNFRGSDYDANTSTERILQEGVERLVVDSTRFGAGTTNSIDITVGQLDYGQTCQDESTSGISLTGTATYANWSLKGVQNITGQTTTSVVVQSNYVNAASLALQTPNVAGTLGNRLLISGSDTPKVTVTASSGLVLSPRAVDTVPTEGEIIYDSTAHKLKVYTGSTWETITSS